MWCLVSIVLALNRWPNGMSSRWPLFWAPFFDDVHDDYWPCICLSRHNDATWCDQRDWSTGKTCKKWRLNGAVGQRNIPHIDNDCSCCRGGCWWHWLRTSFRWLIWAAPRCPSERDARFLFTLGCASGQLTSRKIKPRDGASRLRFGNAIWRAKFKPTKANKTHDKTPHKLHLKWLIELAESAQMRPQLRFKWRAPNY